MEKQKKKPGKKVTSLAASKRFGKYKKEKKKVERKADVKDTKVNAILAVWTSLLNKPLFPEEDMPMDGWGPVKQEFDRVMEPEILVLKDMNYSPADVEKVSIAIASLQEENDDVDKRGLFLSALVNFGKDEEYKLFTKNLEPLLLLGFLNNKRIIVDGFGGCELGVEMIGGEIVLFGDADYGAGNDMKGGKIIIKGNHPEENLGSGMTGGEILVECNVGDKAGHFLNGGKLHILGNVGNFLGFMNDGEIIVEGNAGNFVGSDDFENRREKPVTYRGMKGGSILIKGNAGNGVGRGMAEGEIIVEGNVGKKTGLNMGGGVIHVDGNIGSIGKVIHGQIYHKGKLIVDR
jgi:formylmethanofuran dehydrogenase subunit C